MSSEYTSRLRNDPLIQYLNKKEYDITDVKYLINRYLAYFKQICYYLIELYDKLNSIYTITSSDKDYTFDNYKNRVNVILNELTQFRIKNFDNVSFFDYNSDTNFTLVSKGNNTNENEYQARFNPTFYNSIIGSLSKFSWTSNQTKTNDDIKKARPMRVINDIVLKIAQYVNFVDASVEQEKVVHNIYILTKWLVSNLRDFYKMYYMDVLEETIQYVSDNKYTNLVLSDVSENSKQTIQDILINDSEYITSATKVEYVSHDEFDKQLTLIKQIFEIKDYYPAVVAYITRYLKDSSITLSIPEVNANKIEERQKVLKDGKIKDTYYKVLLDIVKKDNTQSQVNQVPVSQVNLDIDYYPLQKQHNENRLSLMKKYIIDLYNETSQALEEKRKYEAKLLQLSRDIALAKQEDKKTYIDERNKLFEQIELLQLDMQDKQARLKRNYVEQKRQMAKQHRIERDFEKRQMKRNEKIERLFDKLSSIRSKGPNDFYLEPYLKNLQLDKILSSDASNVEKADEIMNKVASEYDLDVVISPNQLSYDQIIDEIYIALLNKYSTNVTEDSLMRAYQISPKFAADVINITDENISYELSQFLKNKINRDEFISYLNSERKAQFNLVTFDPEVNGKELIAVLKNKRESKELIRANVDRVLLKIVSPDSNDNFYVNVFAVVLYCCKRLYESEVILLSQSLTEFMSNSIQPKVDILYIELFVYPILRKAMLDDLFPIAVNSVFNTWISQYIAYGDKVMKLFNSIKSNNNFRIELPIEILSDVVDYTSYFVTENEMINFAKNIINMSNGYSKLLSVKDRYNNTLYKILDDNLSIRLFLTNELIVMLDMFDDQYHISMLKDYIENILSSNMNYDTVIEMSNAINEVLSSWRSIKSNLIANLITKYANKESLKMFFSDVFGYIGGLKGLDMNDISANIFQRLVYNESLTDVFDILFFPNIPNLSYYKELLKNPNYKLKTSNQDVNNRLLYYCYFIASQKVHISEQDLKVFIDNVK